MYTFFITTLVLQTEAIWYELSFSYRFISTPYNANQIYSPEINMSPEKGPFQKERLVLQPAFSGDIPSFSGE